MENLMSKEQKYILKIAAGCIALMMIFPPFIFDWTNGKMMNDGFHFILSDTGKSIVNVGQLFIQWVAVLLIAGLLWFAIKE